MAVILATCMALMKAGERAGIGDSLLRISVGLEHLDDLKEDLERGLTAMRNV